jgi:DNA-binding NtrC family response regulator
MSDRQLIIQASEELKEALTQKLSASGWRVFSANCVSKFKQLLKKQSIHVVLYHIQDTGEQERHKLEAFMNGNDRAIEWVALASAEDLQNAHIRQFVKERFFDFYTLPVDFDRLRMSLGQAYGKSVLNKKTAVPGETIQNGMIGNSPAMLDLYRNIGKAGKVDASVLIRGESGTGKELAARAVHRMSTRGDKPFIAVNCGALPANLIQTELFGHEKGAFTGAHQRKIGRLELAAGGVIFLDEIGDLPMDLQVNLLHVLQDKVIERVGSNQKIQLDVRVIAATHVDLELAVKQGRFREDLYYRLNVIHLEVPPLRERENDAELLAKAYLEQLSKEARSTATGFSHKTLQAIRKYSWPGNVRQLINRIKHAVVMSENNLISPEDMKLKNQSSENIARTLVMARAYAESEAIRIALHRNQNNASEAARELGISRATLYRLLDRHGKLLPNLVTPGMEDVAQGNRRPQRHTGLVNGSGSLELAG